MNRFHHSALAAAVLLPAAASAASFAAHPAAAVPSARLVGDDIAWACGAGGCTGATDYGRPILICQGLAKQAGTIDRFSVDGRAFSAAELARCNASAKAVPASASALARN
ncbi:hypothetical protein ABDK56_06720 [Sphingomonas sp. ASV193]|uniref:CC_3452 family protein n=1 Tax=Sphingomonas sp. ASV193 TaxID=3144405 RepID=UPI0032E8A1C2